MQFMRSSLDPRQVAMQKYRRFWQKGRELTTSVVFSSVRDHMRNHVLDAARVLPSSGILPFHRAGIAILFWKAELGLYHLPVNLRMAVATWKEPAPTFGEQVGVTESYRSSLSVCREVKTCSSKLSNCQEAMGLLTEATELPTSVRLHAIRYRLDVVMGDISASERSLPASEAGRKWPLHIRRALENKELPGRFSENLDLIGRDHDQGVFRWVLPILHDVNDDTVVLDVDYCLANPYTWNPGAVHIRDNSGYFRYISGSGTATAFVHTDEDGLDDLAPTSASLWSLII